nr:hypothetical protein [Tanacetum cinerariifolium]
DIPTHQLNTKFANNLPSYWGKYVTYAKNNMSMSTVTYVKLFTHLRTYEEHALKSLKKKEQSSAVVDPLTNLAKKTPTHSNTSPVTIVTKTVQRRASGNMGTKGIQTTGSGVNNSGKKWYHDKALLLQAKEKRVVLDAEAEEFLADVECTAPYDQPLALTTTNLFEANHKDAYDSDQEEHLNSEVDSVLDDNMITYDVYQNDSGVEGVPTVVSADEADKQSMTAVLQLMHTKIAGYVRVNDEHKHVNATLTAELER